MITPDVRQPLFRRNGFRCVKADCGIRRNPESDRRSDAIGPDTRMPGTCVAADQNRGETSPASQSRLLCQNEKRPYLELHPKSWTSIQPLGCFSWRSMTSDLNIG